MAWNDRTRMLLGEAAVEKLQQSRVAVFGLGGVGGHACEALLRAGVGHLTLIDGDTVDETNLNRQLFATRETLGMVKTEAAKKRLLSIRADCDIEARNLFYAEDCAGEIDFASFDYVADCIDTVRSKLLIIQKCLAAGTPVLSCMGTGNKLDPSLLKIADIADTSVCPLARVMRQNLRKMGIMHVNVIYSTELPFKTGTRTPGSVSFVPSCAGLMIAGEIVRSLIADHI